MKLKSSGTIESQLSQVFASCYTRWPFFTCISFIKQSQQNAIICDHPLYITLYKTTSQPIRVCPVWHVWCDQNFLINLCKNTETEQSPKNVCCWGQTSACYSFLCCLWMTKVAIILPQTDTIFSLVIILLLQKWWKKVQKSMSCCYKSWSRLASSEKKNWTK